MSALPRNDALAVFEADISIAQAQVEIVNRLRIHTEMVARLLADPSSLPPDFSVFLEDVGNAYLDIAEEVNRRTIGPDGTYRSSFGSN